METAHYPSWIDLQACEMETGEKGWQGTVAFDIALHPPNSWIEMRWGFNAGALLEEALDRLRFFVESQHVVDPFTGLEYDDSRTLCLRCLSLPGKPMQLNLFAKICGRSEAETLEKAQIYGRELGSVFPIDYQLTPITDACEFLNRTDVSYFSKHGLAQIRRKDVYVQFANGVYPLFSVWQASARSHEQIWRSLGAMPVASLLYILVRPMSLTVGELEFLQRFKNDAIQTAKTSSQRPKYIADKDWLDSWVERRLNPHKKLFRMQVVLLIDGKVDESLSRNIGAAITRSTNDELLSGIQITEPDSLLQAEKWMDNLKKTDFMPGFSRIDDMADVDEVFSVFRLPYVQNEKNPLYALFF